MNISEKTIIGELVAEDYRTAAVFKRHRIDFCCSGNRSIEEACSKKQIASDGLIAELQQITKEQDTSPADYNTWPLDLLTDYIEKKHHRYVRLKIEEIMPFLLKVARVHGDRHPELIEVESLFAGCAEELQMHMKKEEQILFPFIRKMVQAGGPVAPSPIGTVQNPIRMMMHEHDQEGERFRRIASLTDQYTPPADACNTYQVTFALLKEFEEDLHLHIHLENNILFPKSIELEQQPA